MIARIKVEKISLRGSGVIILTGPSSCGKGEVAAALCKTLSISKNRHLSMGDILRNAFETAKTDAEYAQLLAAKYQISAQANIFDCVDTAADLMEKVHKYLPGLEKYFGRANMSEFTSQLEWLEFCTVRGLLVPNRWTHTFIAAHIEHRQELREKPFILDGYPRTVIAAQQLLAFLQSMDIPVLKVIHLSISKQEMLYRAKLRGRSDDDHEALLRRYNFYIENVQPSVDYLKQELGAEAVALIDAHKPAYDLIKGEKVFNLKRSIGNVTNTALRSLGVPRALIDDLLELDEI